MKNDFLTIGEAAIRYGSDYGTIYHLIKRKQLPTAKINGIITIHYQHIEKYFNSKFNNQVTKWT
jgi:hypothetical protein